MAVFPSHLCDTCGFLKVVSPRNPFNAVILQNLNLWSSIIFEIDRCRFVTATFLLRTFVRDFCIDLCDLFVDSESWQNNVFGDISQSDDSFLNYFSPLCMFI